MATTAVRSPTSVPAPMGANNRSRLLRRERLLAAAYTVPTWLLLLALFAVPLGVGVYLSFRNETLGGFSDSTFVGLENYRTEINNATFWNAARVSATMIVLAIVIEMPIGILLAALLHRELKGTRLFRSALLIPMLLTPVAVSLMWRFMFSTELGIINWFLGRLGIDGINWLGDRRWALVAVVIVDAWQAIPFVMLVVLAGLAGLPKGPIEAAEVDGASPLRVFRYVVLPMLRPVLLICMMIRLIDLFKLFDIIFILTSGGPGTATQNLALLNYRTGFTFLATSRGAAIGVVLALMTLPLYWLWVRATRANR